MLEVVSLDSSQAPMGYYWDFAGPGFFPFMSKGRIFDLSRERTSPTTPIGFGLSKFTDGWVRSLDLSSSSSLTLILRRNSTWSNFSEYHPLAMG